MKTLSLIAFLMVTIPTYSQEDIEISEKIIALEKAALERWNSGDVYGYLELSAEDIVYFDPMLEKRLDGKGKLTELYKPLQGKFKASGYEMIDPKVQAVENMAVLTFNLKSYDEGGVYLWNCTEVYRRDKDNSWKLIQSHWSFTKPNNK